VHKPPWEQAGPGTYLLLLRLPQPTTLAVGRLGALALPAGWYVYVGSALGGLGPRLRRHLRVAKPPHWHVDSLRAAPWPSASAPSGSSAL
jgi:Uri superfamily endonuclease